MGGKAVSRLTAAVTVVTLGALTAAADSPRPAVPSLDLLLKPHETAGTVDYIDIRLTLAAPAVAAGKTLVRLPLVVAGIPTQRYDGEALQAVDDAGALPLAQVDAPPTSFLSNRDWSPTRATTGNVVLRFRAFPRKVGPKTRNGPLFDLREEAGGLDGAGYTFLPSPLPTGAEKVRVHWDLSDMPGGARGVWSLGDNDTTVERPADIIQHAYFYAGPVKSYPATPDPKFDLYWLSTPPFDTEALGATTRKLFVFMSDFFHDRGEPYRIFIRKQPYRGNGGTGLTRSFMFGWGVGAPPTLDSMKGLLAHEMVHNWPAMDGDHADTSWYSEGSAEYYSELLLLRAGLHTPAEFLNGVNEKAAGYYSNPLQTLTNREADAIYWKDSRAGHVPYGRGFLYLAITDAEIRRASRGKRSLRDLVLAIQDRMQRHQAAGTAEWETLVSAELGEAGRKAYRDMVEGKRLIPPPYVFAPCFRPEGYQERPVEFGFDATAVKGPGSKVSGVVSGSEAARAGLQNGDEIVEAPDFGAPGLSAAKEITLKVSREGAEHAIVYAPLAAPIPAWRWVRTQAPDAKCEL